MREEERMDNGLRFIWRAEIIKRNNKMKIKNLPKTIYLQIGEDCDHDDWNKIYPSHEVSWCEDKINNNDIVYRLDKRRLDEPKARSNGNAGYKEPAEHYLYFRKKPVVIEAVRVKEILRYWHQWSKLPEWVRSNYDTGKLLRKESGIELGVKTLEGYLTAGYNDWIIKGVKGEIYPIEETIFLETYEPVSL